MYYKIIDARGGGTREESLGESAGEAIIIIIIIITIIIIKAYTALIQTVLSALQLIHSNI